MRTWIYLVIVMGAVVWFYLHRVEWGMAWAWNVPITILAVFLIGAGQHQLSILAHEGAHNLLFRNRIWNENASDWFCMFPLLGATYHYRSRHLTHHQFVNDPERDSELLQRKESGHGYEFPQEKRSLYWLILRLLRVPLLVRFTFARAKYTLTLDENGPYSTEKSKATRGLVIFGTLYLLTLIGSLIALVLRGDPNQLALIPVGLFGMIVAYFVLVPDSYFQKTRIRDVVSHRWTAIMRLLFLSLIFNGLAWITLLTGEWVALWAFYLWIVPLGTTLSLFTLLRQFAQHGNGGRGRFTNTRVFLVQRLLRFFIFPLSQNYHLPHHLYPTVPHYRLKKLHDLLMIEDKEYQEQALLVTGALQSPCPEKATPSVLDVLGPDHAPPESEEPMLDASVLTLMKVEE